MRNEKWEMRKGEERWEMGEERWEKEKKKKRLPAWNDLAGSLSPIVA